METNAYQFIADFQYLLEHGYDMNPEDVVQRAKGISNAYHSQEEQNLERGIDYCYGLNEFFGLRARLEQLFHFGAHKYVRDEESQLALRLDSGADMLCESRSASPEEISLVSNKVMNFMAQVFTDGDRDEDSDLPYQLITNQPVNEIDQRDLVMINEVLILRIREMVEYVADHRPKGWCWEEDLFCLSQYLFDFFVEYTYKKALHEDTRNLQCDILAAFAYRKPDVPLWLRQRLNEVVLALEGIVSSVNAFIKENGFADIDYGAWLRPVLVSVGQNAIKFALEQRPHEDGDLASWRKDVMM